MTVVTYDTESFQINIEGHAGFAEVGKDIVCAACSCLSQTLVEAVSSEEDFAATVYINSHDAQVYVRCIPLTEARDKCRTVMDTIYTGFAVLAEQYPQYVSIKEN